MFLLIFFVPLIVAAQSTEEVDLTGLWKGTLYNDSTQNIHRYEIGISEEGGKLSGFSHTWFILDNKQYYGVKKVKVRKARDGKILIEDDGLIANNFPEKPAKGVRQLNVLTLEIKDSTMTLAGPFSTNQTKKYSPLTGSVSLQRKTDFNQSALVPHLEELGLAKNLSFVIKEDGTQKTGGKDVTAKLTTAIPENPGSAAEVATVARKPVAEQIIVTEKVTPVKSVPVTVIRKQTVIATPPSGPAQDVLRRNTVLGQTVYFVSDSLQLSLYDNGEVDGDTVSVLMNGEIIMARAGLSTNAVRKTISSAVDSIELVMYAENLGSISPNTGLLVVHDGKSIYEIRFSGDLEKNASIILRRRKN